MANLFDGLDRLDREMMIENIATLKAVNMGNVFKGYGTTATNKSAKAINGIGKLFGKEKVVNIGEEKNMEDYIIEEKNKIKHFSRQELDEKLVITLVDQLSEDQGKSKDVLSASIINSAAKHLKIDENLTVAQKADAIHGRYLEKLLVSIQKELSKQDDDKAKETVRAIERNIYNMSEEEKEQLKDVLNLKNLTGNEIRTVLMKTGTPALVMVALSASGFGAFMGLTTIIHAVFTTILGVTLPFAFYTGATGALSMFLGPAGMALLAGTSIWQFSKGNKKIRNELLSQLIFFAVSGHGGSFVAKDEELPSFESNQGLLEEIRVKDQDYEKLVEDNALLKKKAVELEAEHSNFITDISKYKHIVEMEKRRKEESRAKIIELQYEKRELAKEQEKAGTTLVKQEQELDFNHRQNQDLLMENLSAIRYQEELFEMASRELEDNKFKRQEAENKNTELENENSQLKKRIEVQDQKIDYTEKVRRKEIEQKWNTYYTDFEITNRAIRDGTKFSKVELWEIERALNELHAMQDYRSISISKVVLNGLEYEHMKLSLPSGFPTRILYRILINSNKKVEITRIYKHNEKFLQ